MGLRMFVCSGNLTYTVLFFMHKLILFKSSENRIIDACNISISSSVHFLHDFHGYLHWWRESDGHSERTENNYKLV